MEKIQIDKMTVGMYQTNCYFVYRQDEKKAIVIDPGDKGDKIYDALSQKNISVEAILLTHGHFDHILGLDCLKERVNQDRREKGLKDVTVYASRAEKDFLCSPDINLSEAMGRPCKVVADVYLEDNEEITIASIKIKMILTPGHTVGSCGYYIEEAGVLLCGDTLFCESVGRTDFPTGSMSQIVHSVKDKLFCLPEKTQVYPGHGGPTTIEHERMYNPFCC